MSQATQNWYTHSAKGREGPFSLEEIHGKVAQGEIGPEDFGWCPGMAEWQRIKNIQELHRPLPPTVEVSQTSSSIHLVSALGALSPSEAGHPMAAEDHESVSLELQTPSQADNLGNLDLTELRKARQEGAHAPETTLSQRIELSSSPLSKTSSKATTQSLPFTPAAGPPHKSEGMSWIIKLMMISAVLGGLFYLSLTQVSPDALIPSMFARWFGSLKKLDDVTPEEYETLRAVAASSLSEAGPRLEIALSSKQPQAPALYLVTNLPDHAAFEVHLRAIPSTLVGEPQAPASFSIVVERHLAQTPPIAVPTGYYWLHVLASSQQPEGMDEWMAKFVTASGSPLNTGLPQGEKPILARKVFLGGAPDLDYRTRLKDFQAVRKGKAQVELDALREITSRMETLLNSDLQAATGLTRLKLIRAREQAWEIFNPEWSKNSGEIGDLLQAKPAYFKQTHHAASALLDQLKLLHEKNHALISPPQIPTAATSAPGARAKTRTSASSQLSSESIASAQVSAEAQTQAEQVKAQLIDLKTRLETLVKRLSETQGYFEEETQ